MTDQYVHRAGAAEAGEGRHPLAATAGRLVLAAAAALLALVTLPGRAAADGPAVADLEVRAGYVFVGRWSPTLADVIVNAGNKEPVAVSGMTLTLSVPAGAALPRGALIMGVGGDLPVCTPSGDLRTLTCVAPAATSQVAVRAPVANVGLPAGSAVPLTMTVSSDATDPNPADNTLTVQVTLPAGPRPVDAVDVGVGGRAPANAGKNSTANVEVYLRQDGVFEATDLTLTLTAPDGVIFALHGGKQDGPSCPGTGLSNTMVCTLASYDQRNNIPANVRVTAINVGLPAGAPTTVRAQVTHGEPDADPSNDVADIPVTFSGGAVTYVPGQANAAVSVSPFFRPAFNATTGKETMVWYVTNSGPSPLDAVELTIDADPALAAPTAVVADLLGHPQCSFTFVGGHGTCTASGLDLWPGSSLYVGFSATFTAPAGTDLTVTLSATGTPPDTNLEDNYDVEGTARTATPPTTTASAATTPLPTTGAATSAVLAIGAFVLTAGLVLLAAARRPPAR